jgi:Ca-activated chloride channel family protein
MVKKNALVPVVLILSLVFTMTGCGGGGGGDSATPSTPTGSPTLQVLPASFDFGAVTTANTPAPLVVTIKNNGTAASNSPTIPAADSCTIQVGFQPGTDGTFAGNVQISSNDGSSPVFTLALNGSAEPVATLTVRINQLETSCPSDAVNAYVSVTDQGGYPFTGLVGANFTVIEGVANLGIPNPTTYVDVAYEPISITAVMDYSGTITDQPQAVADMESGFINLFNNLRATDFGEIIKFDTQFEVVQGFTSDKAALAAAVSAPFDKGRNTVLYDAIFKAVDDTGLRTANRRAVVVTTDGVDEGSIAHNLTDVINNAIAKGVPIFTIGIGSGVNPAILEQMAADTGGQFFSAQTSQNLATIYQQLTSVLYEKQYILTFNQSHLGPGGTANLNIKATTPLGKFGDDTMLITSCN